MNGKIVKDGQEVWVQAEKGNGAIWLRIVEKQAMEQYIVADAAAFSNDSEEGRAKNRRVELVKQ